jgi:hypothetical protein
MKPMLVLVGFATAPKELMRTRHERYNFIIYCRAPNMFVGQTHGARLGKGCLDIVKSVLVDQGGSELTCEGRPSRGLSILAKANYRKMATS